MLSVAWPCLTSWALTGMGFESSKSKRTSRHTEYEVDIRNRIFKVVFVLVVVVVLVVLAFFVLVLVICY